jgi:hypothetical protein
MDKTTTRNLMRSLPLALVVALHVVGAVWCLRPVGLASPYHQSLPAAILFPIQISLIAIWLAVQSRLWQRMPWALMAAALVVACYHAVRPHLATEMMTMHVLPGAVVLMVAVRRFAPLPPADATRRLGLRHLLLWTAAVAVLLVLLRGTVVVLYHTFRTATAIEWQPILFSLIIGIEQAFVAALLAILVLRRTFWPWIMPFVLLLLPVISVLESGLFSVLLDYPWYYEWEGLVYGLLQVTILSATLLAWRHSGLLIADT